MGAIVSRSSSFESKRIDSELEQERLHQTSSLKILLLGSADTGKSTIVKQIRVSYLEGFNDTELIDAVFRVRENLVEAFSAIADGIFKTTTVEEVEASLLDVFRQQSHKIPMMAETDELELLARFIKMDCVQGFLSTNPFYSSIPDNFHYFNEHLDRILDPAFIPSIEDMMNVRITTQGVHELTFTVDRNTIRLIDVGGQRTERRKWIHFFEGVSAVIFVASLASFDQLMDDDVRVDLGRGMRRTSSTTTARLASPVNEKKNRLLDSIELFHNTAKNAFLKRSAFVLFLNKIDLMQRKLQYSRMVDHFTVFLGANDYESVADYVQLQFMRVSLPEGRCLYIHRTQATSSLNINDAFAAACHVAVQANLGRSTV